MKLIVGLGNPGPDYALTRHNVGWMVLQQFVESFFAGKGGWREASNSFYFDAGSAWLLKPTTFMNTSGDAVVAVTSYFKIEPRDVIVIHDDMDIPLGEVRVKVGGGHAGHRGVKSVIERLGTQDFQRIRCGIGRPDEGVEVLDHVLGRFKGEDTGVLQTMIRDASARTNEFLTATHEKTTA